MYVKNIVALLTTRRQGLSEKLKFYKNILDRDIAKYDDIKNKINLLEVRIAELDEVFDVIKEVIHMYNKRNEDVEAEVKDELGLLMEKEVK